MASTSRHRVEPSAPVAPQRQPSPGPHPSGFGLSGVVSFWPQQDPCCQSFNPQLARGWRVDSGAGAVPAAAVQQGLHPLLHTHSVASLNPDSVSAPRSSPGRPMAQQPTPHLRANSPQPCSPLLWRSVTPATFVFAGGRSPQHTTLRPVSTCSRLAPTGAPLMTGLRAVQGPSTSSRSQLQTIQTPFWQGAWTQQANSPLSVQRSVASQQRPRPLQQVMQQGAQLKEPLRTINHTHSSLQSRLSKVSNDAPAVSERDQSPCPYPLRQIRGNSPQQQFWRPLSVPPQGHNNKGVAAAVSTSLPVKTHSPAAGYQSDAEKVSSSVHRTQLNGPQIVPVEFKKNRSVSTPPMASHQSPSLASRFWALFQSQTRKDESSEKTRCEQRKSDVGVAPQGEVWMEQQRQVKPTVSWAYPTRQNQQSGWVSGNEERIMQQQGRPAVPHTVEQPATPRKVEVLTSSPRQQSCLSSRTNASARTALQQQEIARTFIGASGDPRGVSAAVQLQEASRQQSYVSSQQRAEGQSQYTQPHMQVSQSGNQPPQHSVVAHLPREHFLLQQQELLRRQQAVLRQQREKLLQQQSSLQQQKQKRTTMLASELRAQAPEQQNTPSPRTGAQGPAPSQGSSHPNPAGSFKVFEGQTVVSSVKRIPNDNACRETETLGAQEASGASQHCHEASSSLALESAEPKPAERETASPPPLEWQLNEPLKFPGHSLVGAGKAAIEPRNLSFSAVGGSVDQRMQLTCEVLVDPAAVLNRVPTASSAAVSPPQELRQSTCGGKPQPNTERPRSSLREQSRQGSSFQESAVDSQSKSVAEEAVGAAELPLVEVSGESTNDERASSAAESDSSDLTMASGEQALVDNIAADTPRKQQPPPIPPPSLLKANSFRPYPIDQHDIIPVGPLIAAVSAAGGWGGHGENGSVPDEYQEGARNIDNYLPIESLSEFESVEKGQKGEDLLDLRRDVVGCGTYGVVRKLRHRDGGFIVAVKSIQKETVVRAGMVSQVEFELYVQRDLLRHQNVLRCFACVEDAEYLHMVLGFCEQGDLYRRIREQPNRRFSELEAFCFFAQLVNGLQCVHSNGVIHRDLKLENLLLTRENILKIADFGWCGSVVGQRRSFSFCGTLDYLAPEMVKGQGHDWRVDIWSLGVLLYELLDGRPPFQSTRHFELVQRIVTVDIRMPDAANLLLCTQHIASDAADLIKKLLKYEPSERLPLFEVAQHPWVLRMWKELQLYLLQLDPTADLEALLPDIPESTNIIGTESKVSSPRFQASDGHQDLQRPTQNSSVSVHGDSTARSVQGGDEASRPPPRCPPIPTRHVLTPAKSLKLPPISSRRRSPTGVSLDLSGASSLTAASADKHSGRKVVSSAPRALSASSVQPRRRSLLKGAPLPPHRSARSASRAPPMNSARQIPTARSCDAAETPTAQSLVKKQNSAKWRPMSARQRGRGRTAPLMDESFDLPVNSSSDSGDDKTHRELPQRQATCSAAQGNRQHAHIQNDAALKGEGGPSDSGLMQKDEETEPLSDPTSLPSLKRVRSISTCKKYQGHRGAVLRVGSSLDRLPDAAGEGSVRVSPPPVSSGQWAHYARPPPPGYDGAVNLPRFHRQDAPTISMTKQHCSPAGTSEVSSPLTNNPAVWGTPTRLASITNTNKDPRMPAATFVQHPSVSYSPQRYFQRTVHPSSFSGCSPDFNRFQGAKKASPVRWYQQTPKDASSTYQRPPTGDNPPTAAAQTAYQQPAQLRRLGELIADIPAVKHLHSPAHSKRMCDASPMKLHATSGPHRYGFEKQSKYLAEGPPSTAANKQQQPLLVTKTVEPTGAHKLPIVFAPAPSTANIQFISNPRSLFC